MEERQEPVKTFTAGPIRTSVFINAGKYGQFYKVSTTRPYPKGDKTAYTSHLKVADIPFARMSQQQAFEWCVANPLDKKEETASAVSSSSSSTACDLCDNPSCACPTAF